jgi:predicted dehydrogenase
MDSQRNRQDAAVLRVGIVGLGPRWQRRYRPALAALVDRFQFSAVCDQVLERASLEGRRLGCAAVAGPAELAQRKDVDAVLSLDAQWFRLWPVEAACRASKPCLCCDTLERDEAHADRLSRLAQASRVPILLGLTSRLHPAARTLKDLLSTRQAQVRLVRCSTAIPVAGPRQAVPCSLALLDWCTSLIEGTPSHVFGAALADEAISTLLLRYANGKAVQITRYQATGPKRRTRELQVITDRGTALVRLPAQVRWTDEQATYLPCVQENRAVEQTLLEQFHAAIRTGQPVVPDVAHVHRLLGWRRLGIQSILEGRWIEVAGEEHWDA